MKKRKPPRFYFWSCYVYEVFAKQDKKTICALLIERVYYEQCSSTGVLDCRLATTCEQLRSRDRLSISVFPLVLPICTD
jgi:hypothetical protein